MFRCRSPTRPARSRSATRDLRHWHRSCDAYEAAVATGVAGANEGIEMPPAIRSKVAEAVAAAAAVLLRLSNGFHGLANYLRLRADGARRIDTDDLSDDLFAELLHDGPSLRLLRIQEPLELERHRHEGLGRALKPVELKAEAAAHAAEGMRRQIEALERRLARTSDPAGQSRLAQRIAVVGRQADNAEVVAKVGRTFGWPAQALSAAAEIADGENAARVAGEVGLVALATGWQFEPRRRRREAPAASSGAWTGRSGRCMDPGPDRTAAGMRTS